LIVHRPMDALECIHRRRTAPVLEGPEPTREELEVLLRAAVTAPDHKLVRPWRFVVIRGEARARLGDAMAAALRERDPAAAPELAERARAKALRAPLSIAVIASPREGAAAPVWEQLASVDAAATTLCLAATALGLGSGWKSTPLDAQPALRTFLSMRPGESLHGLVELGRLPPDVKYKPRTPVDLSTVVTELS